ncbi:uncharacterized protein LOC129052703 isoform X1 [Pongo abelii]|uniref:uncharacterized protein LOC129052703 isoform X1 n=1 Tax=Pongo abelii TaxID=9601 RepID=UPI003004E7D3
MEWETCLTPELVFSSLHLGTAFQEGLGNFAEPGHPLTLWLSVLLHALAFAYAVRSPGTSIPIFVCLLNFRICKPQLRSHLFLKLYSEPPGAVAALRPSSHSSDNSCPSPSSHHVHPHRRKWALLSRKGYQERDLEPQISIITKLRGASVTQIKELGNRLWDVANFVKPPQIQGLAMLPRLE